MVTPVDEGCFCAKGVEDGGDLDGDIAAPDNDEGGG